MTPLESWVNVLKQIDKLPIVTIETNDYSKPEILDRDVKTEKTIYLASDSQSGGDGTKDNPLKTNNFSSVVNSFGENVKFVLKPGAYSCAGNKLPKRCAIIAEIPKSVLIRLPNNATLALNYPHIRMLVDNGWSEMFYADGIIFDGNFQGQDAAPTHGNFKIEPIVVKAIRAKIENCSVINFGSSAKQYKDVGLECFPLFLETFSNGVPYQYDAAYTNLINNEPQTLVEIENCEVKFPYFYDGGYCTAIFIKSSNPQTGDRQPFGIRQTLSAIVKNNYVSVPGGIAYGCAISEMINFKGNVAYKSKCGFNADTGIINNIIIEGNQFIFVNQGINFTPSLGGKNLDILRNTFLMTEPFYNPVLSKNEEFYWLNTSVITNVKENTVITARPIVQQPQLKVVSDLDLSNIIV